MARSAAVTVRPSSYANEYVVVAQVRPDPTQAPTGVVVTEPSKFYVDERGNTVRPPVGFTYLPARPNERDDVVVLETVKVRGTRTYTNTVHISNRMLCPMKWSVRIQDEATSRDTTHDWVLIQEEAGTGAAIQQVERWYERFEDGGDTTPGVFGRSHHNPTQAGAGQARENPPDQDPYRTLRTYGGFPILLDVSGDRARTCCSPMDFGGDGPIGSTNNNHEASDHGDGDFSPTWWYAMKLFQQLQLNWNGNAVAHRFDLWSHVPTARGQLGPSGAAVNYRSHGYSAGAHIFNVAVLIDLQVGLGSAYAIPDFVPGSVQDWFKTWTIDRDGLHFPDLSRTPISLSKYVGLVLLDEVNDFAIGLAFRLDDSDDNAEALNATGHLGQRKLGRPHYVHLQQFTHSTATGDLEEPWGVIFGSGSKSIGPRPAGWIGHCEYLCVGTQADVGDEMVALYTSGALDLEPVTDLPPAVTANTIWPPASAVPTSVAEAPIVLMTGNSQLVSGPTDWLRLEQNAELGKFSKFDPIASGRPRTTDSRKLIWNDDTERWELLQHTRNGGGWADSATKAWGPETSLSQALLRRGFGSAFLVKCGSPGSPLSGGRGITTCWGPPSTPSITVTATVTITPTPTGATITGPAGTFAGVSAPTGLQIVGSASWLQQTGIPFPGPITQNGNNTYRGKPLLLTAISGDLSTLTVSNGAGGAIAFALAAETASLTLTLGKVDLRALAAATYQRAIDSLRRELRLLPRPILSVLQTGEADLDASSDEYRTLVTDHVAWQRSIMGVDDLDPECPPAAVVLMPPHGFSGSSTQRTTIRSAQQAAAAAIPNSFVVDTADLPLKFESNGDTSQHWPPDARANNGTHFTASSILEIGWRIDNALEAFAWFPRRTNATEINPAGQSFYGLAAEPTDPDPVERVALPSSPADIIRTIDEAMASGSDVASYTVDGQTVIRRGADELLRTRRYYEGLLVRSNGIRRTRVQF